MTEQRSDEAADEQRDERGRLYSVVAEGRRFYYVAQLCDNYARVLVERDSLRGVVQAVEALAAENEAWYASDRKTITTRELRAALAAAADAPQLQPAKVTPCWKHDLWDPACYECVDGDGESPLHDERCDEGCVEK